jgi:hypothetical protein
MEYLDTMIGSKTSLKHHAVESNFEFELANQLLATVAYGKALPDQKPRTSELRDNNQAPDYANRGGVQINQNTLLDSVWITVL